MGKNFLKIGKNRYKLEQGPEMNVAARFYASDEILPLLTQDRSLEQLRETAKLPGLYRHVLGMPDMHQGYGIPVGGIIASEDIVSAGCVGMDINCGVRLLRTGVEFDKRVFDKKGLHELVRIIEKHIPIGLGKEYETSHSGIVFEQVIKRGVEHLVEKGYGTEEDIEYCEENGYLKDADIDKISSKALERAKKQVGTLGSGNHFLELQVVEEIFDNKAAEIFGLKKGQLCFMIHSGSRALGHQTCLDYTNRFKQANQKNRPELVPTKNLASAETESTEGQDYLAAMRGSLNFAFANRQMMTHKFREAFGKFAAEKDLEPKVELVYDVAHNSAKWEEHHGKKVLVHRKGSTRALPAGHEMNPKAYMNVGHPALVPGSMGSPSYVLVGTDKDDETFYSVNHGAGRAMSRNEAERRFGSKKEFERQMGDVVFNKSYKEIADEAPQAYKNIDKVIKVLTDIDLTRKVAKLRPLAVIKGD